MLPFYYIKFLQSHFGRYICQNKRLSNFLQHYSKEDGHD